MSQTETLQIQPEVLIRLDDQPSSETAQEFSRSMRNGIILLLVFGVLFLTGIWIWLWHGMHLYQDCL